MTSLPFILLMVFIETFGESLTSRGLFFYTKNSLDYSDSKNLSLALCASFVAGLVALLGHRAALRLGERRTLFTALGMRVAGDLVIFLGTLLHTPGPFLFVGAMLRWSVSALMWSVIESYLTAGRNQPQTSRAVGLFNVAWSLSIPIAVASCGRVLAWRPPVLFLFGAGFHVIVCLMTIRLSARPEHHADDHPHRPTSDELIQLRPLMISARWLNFSNGMLGTLMAALIPGVMFGLGFDVKMATMMAMPLDAARVVMFALLGFTVAWHGRRSVLALAALSMPAGALMIVMGASVSTVILGQILVGLAVGAANCASLYYNAVVHNASVEATGVHEGVSAMGGTTGPVMGVLREKLMVSMGHMAGTLAGLGPAMIICAGGALWPLMKKAPK